MIHVLLAAYNEESALDPVLEKISRVLSPDTFHVWVVDDGSKDRTSDVASSWRNRIPLTLIRHEQNAGLGKAFQTGLRHILPAMSASDVLVSLDADNTQPPELIPALVNPIAENRADMTIASRFVAGGRTLGVPLFRRLTSFGARALFTVLLPIPSVRDYTCGFRAYSGDLLKRGVERWGELVTENGFAAAVEWLARLSALKPRIVEIPLVLRYDFKPTPSKMPVWTTIQREIRLILKLRRLLHS